MAEETTEHQFILFADIQGYTKLMQQEQAKAASLLQKFRTNIQDITLKNKGQVVNFYGDGALCIFETINDVLASSLHLQKAFQKSPMIPVRIGLHCGEVFYEDNNAYGNAINIASRIETVGIPGSITISKKINAAIPVEKKIATKSLGTFTFKNVKGKMEVFAIAELGVIVPKKSQIRGKLETKKTRTIPLILATLVFASLLFFLYTKFFITPQELQKDRSLAILPLENLNQDASKDYLSDGISQDILTNLSGIADLQIISFNSSKKYKGSEKSVQEIGEELGVKHLLLGSVQQADDKLRVRAMLVNSETDEQLWAESFDRDMKDIFEIQSEVAQKIAEILKTKLTPALASRINQKPTQNLDAYQNYSQGRYQWELRTSESLDASIDFFNEAIKLDSSFALAYSGLAQSYIAIGSSGIGLPSITFPKALNNAQKALQLDPNQANALSAIAAYYYDHDFQFEKALDYFEKALALNPSDATTRQWLAEAYYSKGDVVKAREQLEIAKRLDPRSLAIRFVDVFIYVGESNGAKAIEICNDILKQYPNNRTAEAMLFYIYFEIGQTQKAAQLLKNIDPEFKLVHHWIELYARQENFNKLKEFRTVVDQLENEGYKKWMHDLIDFKLLLEKQDYQTYAAKIDTFIFIEKNRNLIGQQGFPAPKKVQDHPRYQQMLKERGFTLIKRDFSKKEY